MEETRSVSRVQAPVINPARRVWHICIHHVAVLAICASVMTGCAHVRPTQSWPLLIQRLEPGTPVTVTTGSGHEVAGRVSAVSAESIGVVANGATTRFAANDVRQVRRNGDSLWNGFAIGAAIGATAAALPDPRYYNCGGSTQCKDRQIPGRLALFAGVTITGILVDAFHRDRTILYQSPLTAAPTSGGPTKD